MPFWVLLFSPVGPKVLSGRAQPVRFAAIAFSALEKGDKVAYSCSHAQESSISAAARVGSLGQGAKLYNSAAYK